METAEKMPVEVRQDLNDMQAELDQDVHQAAQLSPDQEAQASQSFDDTKAVLTALMVPSFVLLAPGWKVQDDEVDSLADAYTGVIEKYFPGGVGKFGVEINAVLITLAVFVPRMGMKRNIEAEDGRVSNDDKD